MRAIEMKDIDFPIRGFLVRGAATPQSAFQADGIPRFLDAHPFHLAFRVSRLVGTPLTKDAVRVDVTYSLPAADPHLPASKPIPWVGPTSEPSDWSPRWRGLVTPLNPEWPHPRDGKAREYKTYTLRPAFPWAWAMFWVALVAAAAYGSVRTDGTLQILCGLVAGAVVASAFILFVSWWALEVEPPDSGGPR